jgi:parallel beta-helix repeat protein
MLITSSDTVIDLEGKALDDSITIRGPLNNIVIRNGTIKGEVRLRPLDMGDSHTQPGHTERIRQSAPSNVRISDITFRTNGSTHQVYFGPGATNSSVLNCNFRGKSLGPSVYLSPEGGGHTIKDCNFAAEPGQRREVLAVDGSRDNLIVDNNFRRCTWGGIYVYRNCGENGIVRHQKPQNNIIKGNRFNLTGMRLFRVSDQSGHQGEALFIPYGVILGSRQGGSSYCDLDSMYPLGSGESNADYAQNNIVADNRFSGDWFLRHVLDNDANNSVAPGQ